MLFLGGYLFDYTILFNILNGLQYLFDSILLLDFTGSVATQYGTGYEGTEIFNSPLLEGMISGLTIGIKSCIMIFVFIWVRASFPRIRFDQLMSFSWTILLPIIIAFIVLIPCIVYSFEIIPSNISLL